MGHQLPRDLDGQRKLVQSACSRRSAGCLEPIRRSETLHRARFAEVEQLDDVELLALCDTAYPGYTASPCFKVDVGSMDEVACKRFLDLPLQKPACKEARNDGTPAKRVPKIYHAMAGTPTAPRTVLANARNNPAFRLNYHNDNSGYEYIHKHCGEDAAEAFMCLAPVAYRADLFRFCALFAEGGVYVDSDQLLLVPLEVVYSDCSQATAGHDFPQGNALKLGLQMKLLAAMPESKLFGCMVRRIVAHVRRRLEPHHVHATENWRTLAITGPTLLAKCYESCIGAGHCTNETAPSFGRKSSVAITYRDARQGAWPYAGMLGSDAAGNDMLLSFETPRPRDFGVVGEVHYDTAVREKGESIFHAECKIPVVLPKGVTTPPPLNCAPASGLAGCKAVCKGRGFSQCGDGGYYCCSDREHCNASHICPHNPGLEGCYCGGAKAKGARTKRPHREPLKPPAVYH